MVKKGLVSLVVASLLVSPVLFGKTSNEVSNDAVNKAKKDASYSDGVVNHEALNAYMLTKKVLVDIQNNDIKQAKKDLEVAIGKLEVLLSNKKTPKLLPIDLSVSSVEYSGSLKDIKETIDDVKDLIDDNKIQDARVLLNTLQSEIDITTINLPLATYPDALKLASKYLHEKDIDGAKAILLASLNTMVQNTIVIPIPILKADALIKDAQKISKNNKKQALKHLDMAKLELNKAEALGYTSKSDITYKTLKESIDKIQKEIKGKNKAEKLFEELIKKVKSFKEKM